MSERDDEVVALLDRAAEQAPPMQVRSQDVLVAGRARVRRRRVGVGAGMALAAAVLGVTVWPGADGLVSTSIDPAGSTWEDGETFEVQLSPEESGGQEGQPEIFLERQESGAMTARFDGADDAVLGDPLAPGVQVFTGASARLVTWLLPDGAEQGTLVRTDAEGGTSGATGSVTEVDGQRLGWALQDLGSGTGASVRDVLFSNDDEVVSARGQQVETATASMHGVEQRMVLLPDSGGWGVVDDSGSELSLDPPRVLSSGDGGGGERRTVAAVLPGEGVQARAVLTGATRDLLQRTEPAVLEQLGDQQLAFATLPEGWGSARPADGDEEDPLSTSLQWQDADGDWHDVRDEWVQLGDAGYEVRVSPESFYLGGHERSLSVQLPPGGSYAMVGSGQGGVLVARGWQPEDLGAVRLGMIDDQGELSWVEPPDEPVQLEDDQIVLVPTGAADLEVSLAGEVVDGEVRPFAPDQALHADP